MSLFIPAGAAATISQDSGMVFGTAISIACTTTRSGSSGPANTVDLNIFYA
jgi:hypothetical protein